MFYCVNNLNNAEVVNSLLLNRLNKDYKLGKKI